MPRLRRIDPHAPSNDVGLLTLVGCGVPQADRAYGIHDGRSSAAMALEARDASAQSAAQGAYQDSTSVLSDGLQ